MARDIIDGELVKWNLAETGQAKAYLTEDDDPGTAGQMLYSQGPGEPAAWGAPPTGVDGGGDFQRFNTSGTWNKPSMDPDSLVLIRVWPAGGGGARGTSAGGGGGGYGAEKRMLLSDLGSSETVTVGLGGAARTTNGNGNAGGDSSFGSHITVKGAAGGTTSVGGGGGGLFTAPSTSTPGEPHALSRLIDQGGGVYIALRQGEGGGVASNIGGQDGVNHGGGGGGTNTAQFNGGSSLNGGGGGGGTNGTTAGTGGASVNAGAGGAAGINGSNGGNGIQPGGGGGGAEAVSASESGSGGDGRVEVLVFPPA